MRARALLLLQLLLAGRAAGESPPAVAVEPLLEHVRLLASDAWEGRGSGSEGERKATAYVAERFLALGLEPAGEAGTFFQRVPVGRTFDVGSQSELLVRPPGEGPLALALDREFRPLSLSAAGVAEGEVVFAGYGIHAPDLGYDDYAGIDAKGRVVVVFRHSPFSGARWKDGRARARHAPFAAKLAAAAARGAVGLVVVNDPASFRERADVLQTEDAGAGEAVIPFAHATLAAARRFFPLAFGATPEDLERAILRDGDPAPASRPGLARATLRCEVARGVVEGRNVCARLRAAAPAPLDELIVVGAHHDHLGLGGPGSLGGPEARGRIHNGADDNASGTAAVLAIAAALAPRRGAFRRSLLFVTFTGEERGLLGSRYFCEHPTVPLESVRAMVNLDMVGRLQGRRLFVGGVKTSPVFRPLLERLLEGAGIEAAFGDGGRAPSDNTSFYEKGKPVLFFFSGMHPDYHRPSDDVEKLDAEGMARIATLAARTVAELAAIEGPIPFQRADAGGFGPPRAVLGIVAGPSGGGGVTVEGLAPNGPAERAGLRAGDVIVGLEGEAVEDLGALQAALERRKAGDEVAVQVRREGETLRFAVRLAQG
jgi:aminopeptidase YwaD